MTIVNVQIKENKQIIPLPGRRNDIKIANKRKNRLTIKSKARMLFDKTAIIINNRRLVTINKLCR